MSNRFSVASGLASSTATWNGGTLPAIGDRVLIKSGHTVTLDGTYEWGDDSTSTISIDGVSTTGSITVAGVLKASRTVSSQLTCTGNLQVTAIGTLDLGTAAEPLPLGVNHNLIVNKSSAPAAGKYGVDCLAGTSTQQPKIWMHGFFRRRNTVLIGAVAVGDTSALVADATGWQVGDVIIFAPTSSALAFDERTILTITPGSGTVATITFADLTNSHANNSNVGNFSSNITISHFTPNSAPGYITLEGRSTAGSNNGAFHVENILFLGAGASSSDQRKMAVLSLNHNNVSTGDKLYDPIKSCSFYFLNAFTVSGSGGKLLFFGRREVVEGEDLAFFSTNSDGMLLERSASQGLLTNCVAYRSGGRAVQSNYSQGGLGFTHNNCTFLGASTFFIDLVPSFNATFNSCTFGPSNQSQYFTGSSIADLRFNSCDIGYSLGKGSVTSLFNLNSVAVIGKVTFSNCLIADGITRRPPVFNNGTEQFELIFDTVNGDLDIQENHKPAGSLYRDTTTKYRGLASLRAEPDHTSPFILTHTQTFLLASGITSHIIGYLRKNASYAGGVEPTVTITGGGITPLVETLSVADTWQQFEFDVTQTSGTTQIMTLTFTCKSTAANSQCWLDGIQTTPFVFNTRHYGYRFARSSIQQYIDQVTVLSESAADAITGLSLNFGTNTLTVTGSVTLSQIYDWVHAQLVKPENQGQPENLTSVDGVSFTSTYDFALSGGSITGDGALAMPDNTLTVTSGGTSTVPITHAAGTLTVIDVTGLVSGSRVQILDRDEDIELFNDISGTSVSLPVTWTADKTIRVKATYCVGYNARLPFEQDATLTANGVSILAAQPVDTVYAANNIDGSTVDEFIPAFDTVLVEVEDTDGVTSVQRLYNWYVYASTLPAGIEGYFKAATAEDAANYRINAGVVGLKIKNNLITPVLIAGARLYRDDGESIFAPSLGPIQLEPGKAYLAQSHKIDEVHGRLGLDAGKPVLNTPTEISFGGVTLALTEDAGDITVTRQ
ncbi:MAG: hypothetical protein Q8K07_10385 [Methylicorpusculum sp.]|uniref:hypothetical protein n=1 Tax=Methylicorpusculum sp. TaxID=2713644 RepID=UPI002730ABC5|nr:hypothetical protein [Methylicorpusculum sp.]MDP2202415.1 hypothetical protein [Methylicorpusculum sp.]